MLRSVLLRCCYVYAGVLQLISLNTTSTDVYGILSNMDYWSLKVQNVNSSISNVHKYLMVRSLFMQTV